MRTPHLRSTQKSRGLASVELALVLPLFVMLMIATAEYGRAFYQYNTLTKTVRDGAQYLARTCITAGVCNPSSADLTAAKNLVVYGTTTTGTTPLLSGMTVANVTITAPVSTSYVTVTATYTYTPMFGAIPALGGTLAEPGTVTASVTMVGLGV